MDLSALRPHRMLAFPFAVVLSPLLWFVFRDADIATASGSANPVQTLGFAAIAVVVSYVVAVGVVVALGPRHGSASDWVQSLIRPSNATLAVFAVISLALGVYVFGGAIVTFPQWLDSAAAVLGLVLGWPLVVCYAGTIALGNTLGTQLPFAVEAVVVALGIALSATWLFVLSGWVAGLFGVSASVAR